MNYKRLEFTASQMVLTSANGELAHLKHLVLDTKEAVRIEHWLEIKLPDANIAYYWKEGSR